MILLASNWLKLTLIISYEIILVKQRTEHKSTYDPNNPFLDTSPHEYPTMNNWIYMGLYFTEIQNLQKIYAKLIPHGIYFLRIHF